MPEPNFWIVFGIIGGAFILWLIADFFIGWILGNFIHVGMGDDDYWPFTQADIDALELAIAGGKRSVVFSDRSVTFESAGDMLKLRLMMKRKKRECDDNRGSNQ